MLTNTAANLDQVEGCSYMCSDNNNLSSKEKFQADFEISELAIRRRITGSEFSLSPVPAELAPYDFRYSNPDNNLIVDLRGLQLYERSTVYYRGSNEEATPLTGLILIENQLKSEIARRLPDEKIEELFLDCYDLMCRFIHGRALRRGYGLLVPARVYEAAAVRLAPYLNSAMEEVDASAVVASGAVMVFELVERIQ